MAFTAANFHVAVDTIGGGSLRIHFYETADSEVTVTGSGYFTNVGQRGVQVGDIVVIYSTTGGNLIGGVSAIDASGNATLAISHDATIEYDTKAALQAAHV